MTQDEDLKATRVASKGVKDFKSSLNIARSTIITLSACLLRISFKDCQHFSSPEFLSQMVVVMIPVKTKKYPIIVIKWEQKRKKLLLEIFL